MQFVSATHRCCMTRKLMSISKNRNLICHPWCKIRGLISEAFFRFDTAKADFSCLACFAYAEALPDKKPAHTVLEALEGDPVGTPVERLNVYRMLSDWILCKGRCQNRVRF